MTAAEDRPPSSSWAGDVVGGRYRLDSPVGQGGMATVWRAVHLDLHRPVAVKFLTIHGGDPDQVKDRFLREARIAAAVRHRNVVDITDFGTTDDGRPFMVMELLEGESLADRMKRDRLFEVPEVVRIGARVLSGLDAVHDAGIVHRDMKPENIFLVHDAEGIHAKLLDFGISRSVEAHLESVVPSADNVLAGTPQYMAPEQARGIRDVDRRSDLWGLGVILYEMLTGQLPFDSEHVGDLIVTIMSEDPTPVQALRPDLSDALAGVIHRALARDRDERFQTAREMRQALLSAATLTAKALQEDPRRSPSLHPKELMDAVGNAYEPGDSGMLDVAGNANRQPAETLDESGLVSVQPDDGPPRRSPGRLALLAAAAGVLLLGAAVAVWASGNAPEDTDGTSAEGADETVRGDTGTIDVTLRRLPEGAAVTVGGRHQDGPVLTIPRDGRERVIEVNVPGYEPWHVTHRSDGDAAYEVELTPLPDEAGERAAPSRLPPVEPGEMIRDPGF